MFQDSKVRMKSITMWEIWIDFMRTLNKIRRGRIKYESDKD